MSLSEFAVIKKYFHRQYDNDIVRLGVGDDCALVRVPQVRDSGQCQALSMDTLVAGVHFPLDTNPTHIAYKSLAVNLSDLAAMGARPTWFSLALTMPDADDEWLAQFSSGLFELADEYALPLIGGDITRGPLSITIQIAGEVGEHLALRRDGAKEGDSIFVSGTLGDAAAGLSLLVNKMPQQSEYTEYLVSRLNRPTPRVALGLSLLPFATSCIDLSDGLLADLSHLCDRSQLGATIFFDQIPVSEKLKSFFSSSQLNELSKARLVAGSGDDYELCFTVPERHTEAVRLVSEKAGVRVTLIGSMKRDGLVECINADGQVLDMQEMGFKHFYNL
ncbi:MAG: thiamine-phosphate kinase [Pseudomonadales bacterium]|nr:thiamine-phosphate kinase [Pseudomonadales bacterium]